MRLAWLTIFAAAIATAAIARAQGPAPAHGGSCTMTLSGAVTATLPCTAALSWNASTGTSVIAIVVPHAAPLQSVNVAIERPGEPQAGTTWKDGDHGAVAGMVVTAKGDPRRAWVASDGAKGGRQGSYALTLASVTPGTTNPDGKGYAARGALTATLAPEKDTRASGTVTMRVQF